MRPSPHHALHVQNVEVIESFVALQKMFTSKEKDSVVINDSRATASIDAS